jgi:hypothetical protein
VTFVAFAAFAKGRAFHPSAFDTANSWGRFDETVSAKPYGENQGCQIFLCTAYQNGKIYQNDHEIYQLTIKCMKWQ